MLSLLQCFHFNPPVHILHVMYLSKGRHVNTLSVRRHSWSCSSFGNGVGKRASARPGQHILVLLANQEAVLQKNPKQIFFFSVNGHNYQNFTQYFNLTLQFNFPSTFNIQPFKMHIYRTTFALTSFQKSYQVGGDMLWLGSGCEFLLLSISFSPDFCYSSGNELKTEKKWGPEARMGKGVPSMLSGVPFLGMKSQGAATTFYMLADMSLISYLLYMY